MVNFRRLKLGDLDPIYKDPELRPLITTLYNGNSFAIIIELENEIIGGASGYAVDNAAFMKNAIVKEMDRHSLYMDGLIRSLIHFLELDGLELLFVEGDNTLYSSIGFQKLRGTENFLEFLEIENTEVLFDSEHTYWIDLKEFFQQQKEIK